MILNNNIIYQIHIKYKYIIISIIDTYLKNIFSKDKIYI